MLPYPLFALSAVLIFATPALGQSKAVIEGPQNVAIGALVKLDSGASKCDTFKWIVPPELRENVAEFGHVLVFASGVEGAYKFGLVVGDKEPTVDYTEWTVVVGTKPPVPPGPGPKPQPDPQPQPFVIERGSWILIVDESDDRYKYPHYASLQANAVWNKRIKDRGLEIGWYDRDANEVKSWRAEAEKTGLPAIMVIDPKGKVVRAKTLPPSEALVDEFLFGPATQQGATK